MFYSQLNEEKKKYRKYHFEDESAIAVVGKAIFEAYSTPVPYGDIDAWNAYKAAFDVVEEAVLSDKIEIIEDDFVESIEKKAPYLIKDDLGVSGVLNHADGKMYDSKSAYYQSLKDSGHVVVEAGMDKPREQRGNFDVHKELKSAAQEHGFI